MKRFARILACTDFSETGNRAIEAAFRIALQGRMTVVLAHVLDALPIPNPMYAHYYPAELWDPQSLGKAETETRRALKALVPKRARSNGPSIKILVGHGPVVDEILRIAEESNADLILVGTHGRGRLGHLLLGSVAERVVRVAPCSVLVVR